jgi:hypothetical protein
VLVSWVDFRHGTRCAFASSRDGGNTWDPPFYIGTTASGYTGDAVVSADAQGNFYAACQDYGALQILYSNSTDGGGTWNPWKQVQDSPDKPWIHGARNGTVFLTWLGTPGGYRRSVDAGKTWEPVISLGDIYQGTSISSGLGGDVHLLYNYGQALRYRRSRDWGATLDAGRNIVADMGVSCFTCAPRQHPIVGGASDPGGKVIAAVWSATLPGGDGDDDVWAVISRDSGNTWGKPIRVNDNANASRQFQPWVAVDRFGRVHAVWTDLRNGYNAIFYASTLDGKFGPNTELTDQHGLIKGFYGDYKGLTIQGNDLLVGWADSRNGDNDVYFSRGAGLAGPGSTNLAPPGKGQRSPWSTRRLYNAKGARVSGGAAGEYWRSR